MRHPSATDTDAAKPATYDEFLHAKIRLAPSQGFDVDPADINPALKPHIKMIVPWMLNGGRRAFFGRFGMQKTTAHIECMRLVQKRTGGLTLIILPLGARLSFFYDAAKYFTGDYAVTLNFVRHTHEMRADAINITNFESVREGKVDPSKCVGATIDEGDILKSFGGTQTFRTFMRVFETVQYRFVATATPDPNEYIELLAYAAWLDIMDVGQAKAQPLDTSILTPTGWRRMGDLRVGDQVIAQDGTPTKILGVYPQGERPVYRVTFSDGGSTECDADHLWLTQTTYERNNERRYPKGDRGSVRTTFEIANSLTAPTRNEKNHTIPIVDPVKFDPQPVDIDPWLLGALIGDGCIRKTSVVFSSVDQSMVETVKAALPQGLQLRRTTPTGCDYSITTTQQKGGKGPGSNPLLNALRGYGLLGKRSYEKSIPREFLFNSIGVRLAVLRGLMDTDGTVHRDGTMQRFCTTSQALADDVQFLVRSLGGIATIRQIKNASRGAYIVLLTMPNGVNPFSLPRKAIRVRDKAKYGVRRYITAVEPVGTKPAQCIAIDHPSRLYVTDDFVVTHNTRFFKRNSEKADKLTIHPHKEKEFWLWVASWALFLQKPSDLDPSLSDEGYDLPPLDIRWHEIPADHAGFDEESDGQKRLLRGDAIGVQAASKEKRDSLKARIAKMMELRAENPSAHRILWHDLEAERHAIERAIPTATTVFGNQDLEEREQLLIKFAEGEIAELAGKPMMIGSGPNFQFHCWWAIYLGIGFKFKDFVQSIHRIQRYGQTFSGFAGDQPAVRIDLIYTEREREIRRNLEDKWQRYDEQAARMSALIREYGLAQAAIAGALVRTMGATRAEVSGERFTCVNNDCVDEVRRLPDNSAGLIITSIPFSTQYEYTPSYNDFGHTDDNAHFWAQMDFLTPELYRVLEPGRICAIHCKDRITPGSMTGLGFQTVQPFGAEAVFHYMRHGFGYLGTKTIVTDVVRENNQTYRLGWTEQCKDGSRMGFGLPEYLHIFRKPPTDRTNGYADIPVVKSKETYTRGRWQFDAHGFGRSGGNRFLQPSDLVGLDANLIFKRFKAHSLNAVYDFELDVALANALDANDQLPPTFMLMQPQSLHDDVWTDITRMRTLNGLQHAKGKELHLCPLQFDIVDRAITQYTNEGDLVLDPFGGLMTVPYCAIKLKRRGYGIELSTAYWRDGVAHCQAAEREVDVPTLFDLMSAEVAA